MSLMHYEVETWSGRIWNPVIVPTEPDLRLSEQAVPFESLSDAEEAVLWIQRRCRIIRVHDDGRREVVQ